MRSTHSALAGLPMDPASKAERLRRFVGPMAENDAQMVAFWRERSAAEHGRAGAELSDMAAQMAAQTGLGKRDPEMFPGLSSFQRRPSRAGS